MRRPHSALPLWFGAALAACSPGDPGDTAGAPLDEDTSSAEAEDTSPSDTGSSSVDEGGGHTQGGWTASGSITWTMDFDSTLEAEGYYDCSYTRVWSGAQILDQDYLCPECDALLAGAAEIVEGYDDCYGQLSSGEQTHVEYWGYGPSAERSGDLAFYRSNRENSGLGELASITAPTAGEAFTVAWESEYDFDTGLMLLSASGSGAFSWDDTLSLFDPDLPRGAPYACGWPTNNPGDLVPGDATTAGAAIPNAALEDACGEQVSIWDFYGNYLIIDNAQPNCGPCQQMSEAAPEALEAMRAEGLPVYAVTVLGASLSDILSEPDDGTWGAWLEAFQADDPILKDRGYGYALTEISSYPVYALVAPDMTLLSIETGYGSGTWDEIAATLRAHQDSP